MCLEGGCVCSVVLVTGCDLSTSKDLSIAINSVSVLYAMDCVAPFVAWVIKLDKYITNKILSIRTMNAA